MKIKIIAVFLFFFGFVGLVQAQQTAPRPYPPAQSTRSDRAFPLNQNDLYVVNQTLEQQGFGEYVATKGVVYEDHFDLICTKAGSPGLFRVRLQTKPNIKVIVPKK